MSAHVLIIDDEPAIRTIVSAMLEAEGFTPHEAGTVEEARDALDRHDIAVAIVDLRLRGEDGLEIVRELSIRPEIATLIVSGKADPVDRVIGLEAGADDYVTKPFDQRELTARVRRQISRVEQIRGAADDTAGTDVFQLKDWTIDTRTRRVCDREGSQAHLTEPEFSTLVHLLENRGTALSRDDIHCAVIGDTERRPDDRRIDVWITALRKKLGLPRGIGIRTVHRVGYVID